jgi:hypothetical protein
VEQFFVAIYLRRRSGADAESRQRPAAVAAVAQGTAISQRSPDPTSIAAGDRNGHSRAATVTHGHPAARITSADGQGRKVLSITDLPSWDLLASAAAIEPITRHHRRKRPASRDISASFCRLVAPKEPGRSRFVSHRHKPGVMLIPVLSGVAAWRKRGLRGMTSAPPGCRKRRRGALPHSASAPGARGSRHRTRGAGGTCGSATRARTRPAEAERGPATRPL